MRDIIASTQRTITIQDEKRKIFTPGCLSVGTARFLAVPTNRLFYVKGNEKCLTM